ncbi:MFS transporter [Mucilaginibacter dorajii]|uniref:MFS transporter n=1 Tax=Mucilaginibacter dorajii TaxID=692994 RepID=A0ABP7Q1A7_9SPHI|nr:MFS transporter [Mucilaginibacter dorajii]MCS3732866.1 EmrB/QacA subfamily drug resistance transporter [Mucilaginibacter dorajii]
MKTETLASLRRTDVAENSTNNVYKLKIAIAGISISLFMMNLDTSIVSVGLPTMIKSFKTTFASAQWFVLSYLLVLTALITIAGRLGDIVGKKKLYLTGIAIFTTASLLCGVSNSAALFILFRGLQGLGAALILALSMAIATELTPKKQLGKIMGVLSTITALGIASGPTVGGILLSTFGWQSMFLVNIPFGIMAYGLGYKYITNSTIKKSIPVDWVGIILLAVTLSAYCFGMTMIEKSGFGNPIVLMLLAVTVIGLFAFVQLEKRIAHPLINVAIFKNRLISKNLVTTVLVYTVIITTVILPPFYLSKAAHYSLVQVGLIMSFGPLLTVALSIYAGKIADRYGAKNVMFYAVLTIAIGCFCMSTITPAENIGGYLWRIGIIALGLNFFKTPNNTLVMEVAQADQRGLLSGVLSLSRILGQITGTTVMGVIFAVLSGVSGISKISGSPRAITYGFDKVFLIDTFIAAFAALLIYPKFIKPNA